MEKSNYITLYVLDDLKLSVIQQNINLPRRFINDTVEFMHLISPNILRLQMRYHVVRINIVKYLIYYKRSIRGLLEICNQQWKHELAVNNKKQIKGKKLQLSHTKRVI